MMRWMAGWRLFVFLLVTTSGVSLRAQTELPSPTPRAAGRESASRKPRSPAVVIPLTPQHEDATLRDIAFVGNGAGVAVGDGGAVWKTEDAGVRWDFVPTPSRAHWRSVCFLTDRVGWIAGFQIDAYTRVSSGTVLFTRDGGQTWEEPASQTLPALMSIRFFDLNSGVAVGEATADCPTGVLATEDGGTTWQPVPGSPHAGWRAADFVSPEVGFVAGMRGSLSLVGGGRMLAPRVDGLGLRTIHDVHLDRNDSGWIVGDGALVLRTENGGVSWKEPTQLLPDDLRDFTDFHSVAVRGTHVWIAGNPGSAIWHSADEGQHWESLRTGHSAPLHALNFVSETTGTAVGALGVILRTVDGGKTWTSARGAGRRAALLDVHAWPGRIPFELLATQSAELGYRSVVMTPVRQDVGPEGADRQDADLRLAAAVVRAGGSHGEAGWRFPLALPGLEKNADRLIDDWNRRTEGRLSQVFLGSMVAAIRAWRPSVVVLDQPPDDDAATLILNDAILKAVEYAADSTRYLPQQELAGLASWKVERVYLRLSSRSRGHVQIDPFAYLPRARRTVHELAASPRRLVAPDLPVGTERQEYRLVRDLHNESDIGAPRDFLAASAIGPDSDARRRLLAIDGVDEQDQERAQKQRNFHAYVERVADDERQSSQLIAQLRDVTAGMRDEQAALQLADLAEQYRRRSRWDLVEATLVEMVERFPGEPASKEAMIWLFQRWTGAEPAWQRARATSASMRRLQSDPQRIASRIARVAAQMEIADPALRDVTQLDFSPDPVRFEESEGQPQVAPGKQWRAGAVQHWHDQAVRMASLIRKTDPDLYRRPEVQFPLATLMRQRGVDRFADAVYRQQQSMSSANPWRQVADTELWLVQPIDQPNRPVHRCHVALNRPVLDGVLSDECWQNAVEIRIQADGQRGESDAGYTLAMIARDNEYLYFAASIRRNPLAPKDRPVKGPRSHDADLSRHDRISLYLDVDRDYATWYAFHVDQRGKTSESCWDDASWNPKWYVAVDADETHWRVEAAVPFEELAPVAPTRDQVWSAGIVRTIPAVGVESWTPPSASRPRPESFGLLRFDAAN